MPKHKHYLMEATMPAVKRATMPAVKKATPKKATGRKAPTRVKRTVQVAVELKGTGCDGQAITLSMKAENGKLVIDASESDGYAGRRSVRSANGTFKTTVEDLRQALDLVSEPITIQPGGSTEAS